MEQNDLSHKLGIWTESNIWQQSAEHCISVHFSRLRCVQNRITIQCLQTHANLPTKQNKSLVKPINTQHLQALANRYHDTQKEFEVIDSKQ